MLDRTAELLSAKNEAERANLSKSEFLSRMSHELQPFGTQLGFGQLLEISLHNSAQQEHTRQIIHGGKRLLALINRCWIWLGLNQVR